MLGDMRPAPMRSLDRPNRQQPELYLAVCSRWGDRNEKIQQDPCELGWLRIGALADVLTEPDIYVSQAVFTARNRRAANLYSIALLFVDIDFRNVPGPVPASVRSPQAQCRLLLEHLDRANIPRPSYVLASGRGLHVKWLTSVVPKTAVARWSACMKQLCLLLHLLGADGNCKDSSRILRAVGSMNSRSGTFVHEIWRNANDAGGIRVYQFDELAKSILPVARTTAINRKKRVKAGSRKSKGLTQNGWTLWRRRLDAIELLFKLRGYEHAGIPDGRRVISMMLIAVALSHLVAAQNIMPRLRQLRDRYVPHWSDEKLAQTVSTIVRLAAQGTRHRYRTETLATTLCLTQAECRQHPDLGASIEDIRNRKALREAERRRSLGVAPIETLRQQRLQKGLQIADLRRCGASWAEVCRVVGVSRATANRLLLRGPDGTPA